MQFADSAAWPHLQHKFECPSWNGAHKHLLKGLVMIRSLCRPNISHSPLQICNWQWGVHTMPQTRFVGVLSPPRPYSPSSSASRACNVILKANPSVNRDGLFNTDTSWTLMTAILACCYALTHRELSFKCCRNCQLQRHSNRLWATEEKGSKVLYASNAKQRIEHVFACVER